MSNEIMSFEDVAKYIAQGVINLNQGIETQKGSLVHQAMRDFCRLLACGKITAADLKKFDETMQTPIDAECELV